MKKNYRPSSSSHRPAPKKPEPPNPELDQVKQNLKDHQTTLFIKSLEFEVVRNIETNKINEMLLDKNLLVYDEVRRIFEDEPEILIPPVKVETYGDRTASAGQYAKHYLDNKRDIYTKLKTVDLKTLTEVYEQNRRLFNSAQVEDKEMLYAQYQEKYMSFLQNQPQTEYDRRKMISDLASIHEMVSALKNVPQFEKPTFWSKEPMSESDSAFVKDYIKEKINEITNKYDFKQEEFEFEKDKDDITNVVREYLNANLYKEFEETKLKTELEKAEKEK